MILIINRKLLNSIYREIKKHKEIVIARHIGPDPDAVASQMALKETIIETFPEKSVYAVGLSVSKFKFYGNIDHPNLANLDKPLLIVVDVPNYNRIDGVSDLKYSKIIKIDHHPLEDIVGDIDWTDTNKSSASQMVAELILNTKLVLNKKAAENLFLGIVSDSERFSLQNTTYETFDTVKELLRVSKIDFVPLYDVLYTRPFQEHKFIAYITNNLIIDKNKFGYIIIKDSTLKEYGVDIATPSNLINNYHFIDDLLVWAFITEDVKNDLYKVSIRSRGPIINGVASKYNGGGHKFASGAKIKTLEDVNKFIKDLSKVCEEYEDNKMEDEEK